MFLHPPPAPSPNPDAFLVDASAAFRHCLAAFQQIAEIIDDLDGNPSCRCQVTALQHLAEQLVIEWRRLAGDIIATPARNPTGREAKAAALRAYLERVGEQGACIESAWALSLANDVLGDFGNDPPPDSRPPRRLKPLRLLLFHSTIAVMAARRASRKRQSPADKQTIRWSPFADSPASLGRPQGDATVSLHRRFFRPRSQPPCIEEGRNSEDGPLMTFHRLRPTTTAAALGALVFALSATAFGQVAATLNGPPIQVQPYASEPGVPAIQIPLGTPTPPSTGEGAGGSGLGADGSSGSNALSTLLGTSWGAQAVADAQALGVSASAVAATCVMESGCTTDPASHGTISGTFQMTDSTYLQMVSEAEARDPSLTATIPPGLAGKTDPATQSIAAAQYLYDGVQTLQAAGIADPTFGDARALYQFGISGGEAIALADPSDLISSHLSLTPSQYAANGINPATTTVGQWRQSVANKVGNAANIPVLSM